MPARCGFATAAVAGDQADAAHVDQMLEPGVELGQRGGLEQVVGRQIFVEGMARKREVLAVHQ